MRPDEKMKLEEMNPFVRYVYSFTVPKDSIFIDVVPYDYRLIYIYAGNGYLRIDGVMYPAYQGCVFLWPPGVTYSYYPDEDAPFSMYGVNFDFTMSHAGLTMPLPPANQSEFRSEQLVERVLFADFAPFNGVVHLEGFVQARGVLHEIITEFITHKNYYRGRMRGLLLTVLHDIARELAADPGRGDRSASSIDEIIFYIHANWDKQLSNAHLADVFNFHPAHLSRLVKHHTGMPLHQYLLRYRLSIALNLLQTTDLPVAEIARQTGFPDNNYFSRRFKKQWGKSPQDYRAGR